MIVCPHCRHENQEGVERCASCERELTHYYRLCPSCGALNPPTSVYCGPCYGELLSEGESEALTDTPVTPYEPPHVAPPPEDMFRKTSAAPCADEEPAALPIAADVPSPPDSNTAASAPAPAADASSAETIDDGDAEGSELKVAPEADEPRIEGADATPEEPTDQLSHDAPSETVLADETSIEAASDEDALLPDDATIDEGECDRDESVQQAEEAPPVAPETDNGALAPVSDGAEDARLEPDEATTEADASPGGHPEVLRATSDRMEPGPPAEEPESPDAMPPADSDEAASDDSSEPSPEQETAVAMVRQAAESPLENADQLLPLEPAISLPHRAEPLTAEGPDEVAQRDAALFVAIATEPAPLYEPTVPVEPRKTANISRFGRALLYLAVLLAAVVPVFVDGRLTGLTLPGGAAVGLADMVDTLSPGDAVLLSFDYRPAYAGELDPLAAAFVRDLLSQDVRVLAMSTRPEGVGLAESLLVDVLAPNGTAIYGEDCVLLGLLPGQEAGLRSLGQSIDTAFKRDHILEQEIQSLAVMRGLSTVADLKHVVVLGDDARSVRRWIEQIESRHDVAMSAFVTARVEPMLIPYLESGQLEKLVTGAFGAADYAQLGGASGRSNSALSYTAIVLVIVLVAIAANVGRGRRPRTPGRSRQRARSQ